VAGFDIIYACQDADFDQRFGLYSIPARFGIRRGLAFSKLFHAVMVLLLLLVVHSSGLSVLSWFGVFLVAAALLYEHCLVGPDNLSRVNTAFFTMNSLIGATLLLFVGLDIWLLS
jgi:4-hydroxybenzoate polyprenyltransferase